MINKGIEHRDTDRPCMLGFMFRMLALFNEWSNCKLT